MKTSERTGNVVDALTVHENDQIMLITTGGQMVRIRVSEIREAGRNTMGVKLINLIEGETLQDIAPVVTQEDTDDQSSTAEE
jgi:DNA gyrase subunit A